MGGKIVREGNGEGRGAYGGAGNGNARKMAHNAKFCNSGRPVRATTPFHTFLPRDAYA